MNYNCPQCEHNLQRKYIRSTPTEEDALHIPFTKLSIKKRVLVCPSCETILEVNSHPFDEKLVKLAQIPLLIFFAGLFLESTFVKALSVFVLLLGCAWTTKVINSLEYKAWRYWRVPKKRL